MKQPLFWKPAPEANAIAQPIIEEHHSHLMGVTIEYVFRSKHKSKCNKVTLADASIVTGRNAFFYELALRTMQKKAGVDVGADVAELPPNPFFCIEIALDYWETLTEAQRIALIDHELCHCQIDDEGALTMVGHDVEEFGEIVRRHGLWTPDLLEFDRDIKQLELPLAVGN